MKFEEITADITADEILRQAWRKGKVLSIIIGVPVYAVLRMRHKKMKVYRGIPYIDVGMNWGGFSCGWFFVCSKTASIKTKNHEIGHLIQNAKVGGFKMLAMTVFSMLRYHTRKLLRIKTPYDAWWFEEQATKLGKEWKGDE